jgi:hypothetical protein
MISNENNDFTISESGLFVRKALRYEMKQINVTGPGSVNDANFGDEGVLRISNTGGGGDVFAINGIANGLDGLVLYILSVGTGPLVFNHQNTGSSAANRFITYDGSNVPLNPGRAAFLIYDGTSARWRVFTFAT